MNTRIILVSMEGDARQAYLDAIKPLGVQVDTVSSFNELYKLLTNNHYNGVLLDLKTKIKEQKENKQLVYEILERFPLVQLNFDEKTKIIRSLYFGQSVGSGTIEEFVNEECRSFEARPIRSNERKQIYFNVIIIKNGHLSEDDIDRTVTIDVSKGGCFIYSTDNWEINNRISIKIKELENSAPILCEVRWKRAWGKRMQVPGIGVKFENIDEVQLQEFCDKAHIV